MSGQFGYGSAGSSPPSTEFKVDASGRASGEADFEISFHGSVAAVTPLTAAAREWVKANVHTEPWQWLGNATFIVDHRFVQSLINSILDAGMSVR